MKKQKCIWSVEIQLDSDVTENIPTENVRAVQNFQVPSTSQTLVRKPFDSSSILPDGATDAQ